jgi:multiple sugar transport system permease protein
MSALVIRRGPARKLLWAVLAVVLVMYGFPFVYLVLTSFKPPLEAISVAPTFWPRTWTFVNYHSALSTPGVPAALINSVVTAVISTVASLVLAVPAAYGVIRYTTVPGRLFIMLALLTRMIPPIAIGVPLVSIMASLHLTDTSIGLALAQTTISLPLSIWLMASFFEAVPHDLEEAALVDGCGRLQALARVILPVVRGGLAVTALFAFLASWNEFMFALLLTATRAGTTPIAIANFETQYGLQWGSMTALATLYSVPVVLLALLLQRHIVSGLTLGAVKA